MGYSTICFALALNLVMQDERLITIPYTYKERAENQELMAQGSKNLIKKEAPLWHYAASPMALHQLEVHLPPWSPPPSTREGKGTGSGRSFYLAAPLGPHTTSTQGWSTYEAC